MRLNDHGTKIGQLQDGQNDHETKIGQLRDGHNDHETKIGQLEDGSEKQRDINKELIRTIRKTKNDFARFTGKEASPDGFQDFGKVSLLCINYCDSFLFVSSFPRH